MQAVPTIDHVDAVLLDMDGTLVDSEGIHLRLHREILAPLGVVITDADVQTNVGTNDDVTFYRRLLQRHGVTADIHSLIAAKEARTYQVLNQEDIPVLPGAHQLVAELLARDLPFAVVTSTKRQPAQHILQRLSWQPPVLVSYDDVSHHKPHPQPYQLALQQLPVSASRAIAFEDSQVGITSAVAAGVVTVAMAGMVPAQRQLALGAVRVINDFRSWLELDD